MEKVLKIKASEKMIELSRLASSAAQGFFVLGELEGIKAFRGKLVEHLVKKGWSLEGKLFDEPGYTRKCSKEMYEKTRFIRYFSDFYTDASDSYIAGVLEFCLNRDGFENSSAFYLEEKNLAALEQAIKSATEDVKQTYGDPLAVKYRQRSIMRAAFDAVKANVFDVLPSQETQLNSALRAVVDTMRYYRDQHEVLSYEFQNPMTKCLEKRDWPINSPLFINLPIVEAFWNLVSAAKSKTSLDVRYYLQDDNVPPRKPYREAKDFILNHIEDISLAVQDVTKELYVELPKRDSTVAGSKKNPKYQP